MPIHLYYHEFNINDNFLILVKDLKYDIFIPGNQ